MASGMNEAKSRKRILWVCFLLLDIHLHRTTQIHVLESLARRGHDVSLIAVHSRKRFISETADISVISVPLRYVPLISNAIFVLMLLLFLPFVVLCLKTDHIVVEPHGITVFGLISTFLVPRSIRPKIVLDIRSPPVDTVGFLGHLRVLCFNTSILLARRLFDGMTIITPLMREEICDRFHIDPRFVGVWTSGVSQELFKPDRHVLKGTELKRRIGLNGKFLIIYHGVFTSERGLGKLVDSIALLEDKYRTITLFLLGTGPALAELRKSIQEKGIHDRVVIHEPVDLAEVPKYIAMCDAGILTLPDLPIWRYQCPLKLLEYLAMEKVAIVTDLPASREIIRNSKCGIYASSAQPEDIAKAIMYAYDNKEKLGEWGAHGRKVIEERYTWTKVAEDLDRYLTDC